MALHLAPVVINNAFVDLDSFSHGGTNASPRPITYALPQPSNKKRKHATLTGSTSDHQNGVGLEFELPKSKPTTLIAVQIAALQALEALLTVGGSLRSESWRPNVDFLLITVATNACEAGWANEGEHSSTWADFQLATLRALLASLLSLARCRPQYLSRGLQPFQSGNREIGTNLAEFCAHALLALEVLIHPRSLPLADRSLGNCNTFDEVSNCKFTENPFSSAQKQKTPFSRAVLGFDEPDPDDNLYESWLANGEEVEAPESNTDKNMENSEESFEKHGQHTNADPLTEKLAADGPVSTMNVDLGRSKGPTGTVNVEAGSTEELMASPEISHVPVAFSDVGTTDEGVGHSSRSAIEFTKTNR